MDVNLLALPAFCLDKEARTDYPPAQYAARWREGSIARPHNALARCVPHLTHLNRVVYGAAPFSQSQRRGWPLCGLQITAHVCTSAGSVSDQGATVAFFLRAVNGTLLASCDKSHLTETIALI